jgi:phosphoglycerol transferase MdoB-like AlkP superfamily enzyme
VSATESSDIILKNRPLALTGSAAFVLALVALGALTLMLYRVGMLVKYAPTPLPSANDLGLAFWMGLRFDLKVMALAGALPLILGWLLPQRARSVAFAIHGVLVFLVIHWLGIVNYFYFGFFGSIIDPMIFGLFEDDTEIVFNTLIDKYPVIPIVSAWLLLSAAQSWLVLKLAKRLPRWRLPTQRPMALYVVTIVVIALLARGSLGSYALGSKYLSVCTDDFANQLVPNAIEATALAFKRRAQASLSDNPLAGLRGYGFKTPQQAAAVLGLPQLQDEAALRAALYARTPDNPSLAARPPHVVVALMESMGRHLLQYQSPKNDLLGRLSRHFEEDYTFSNVVSGQHGTHRTVESLLINTPITPLTQGRYGYQSYLGAAALPYQRAGYRTVFLTSGPATWRNLADTLGRQGFSEIHDISDLRKRFPDAEFNIRGAPDALTFQYARELLEVGDRDKRPVFVFIMTTYNHPPHLVPKSYKPLPLDLQALAPRIPADRQMAMRIMETYQYASDALGGFLDDLKRSPLADHTVIAASGDHNTRDFFIYTGRTELPLAYGVPLYFYLPPSQRSDVQFDAQRFASHRDLFPTLYRHSLSGACYLAVGNDLLTDQPQTQGMAPSPNAGLALYDNVLTPEGAVAGLAGGRPQFLRWTDAKRTHLAPFDGPVPEALRQRARRERAYMALLDWQTRVQALKPEGPTQVTCTSGYLAHSPPTP